MEEIKIRLKDIEALTITDSKLKESLEPLFRNLSGELAESIRSELSQKPTEQEVRQYLADRFVQSGKFPFSLSVRFCEKGAITGESNSLKYDLLLNSTVVISWDSSQKKDDMMKVVDEKLYSELEEYIKDHVQVIVSDGDEYSMLDYNVLLFLDGVIMKFRQVERERALQALMDTNILVSADGGRTYTTVPLGTSIREIAGNEAKLAKLHEVVEKVRAKMPEGAEILNSNIPNINSNLKSESKMAKKNEKTAETKTGDVAEKKTRKSTKAAAAETTETAEVVKEEKKEKEKKVKAGKELDEAQAIVIKNTKTGETRSIPFKKPIAEMNNGILKMQVDRIKKNELKANEVIANTNLPKGTF